MITVNVHIRKYDWRVLCFFAVSCYYTDRICQLLEDLECSDEVLHDAHRQMDSCSLNSGLTYSNPRQRTSVMVTSITSNAAEFLDSFTHETGHLACHICKEMGIDLESEEHCYLIGDVARELYPYIRELLCCHCHHSKH